MTSRSTASGQMSAVLYWAVVLATWLFVNAMAAMGLIVGLFMLMSNLTWHQFFIEARSLSEHFLGAPAAARSEFESIVHGMFGIALAIMCAVRFSTLRTALRWGRGLHAKAGLRRCES